MKNIILKSKKHYSIKDFSLDAIVKNEDLLSELEMATLPETMQKVLGNTASHLYLPILLKKIEQYDKSDNVNSFIYQGNKYWLDKQQRSCMKTLSESGLNEIEVILGDTSLTLPSDVVNQFILQLEAYAYKCYVNTSKHLQAASQLNDPHDAITYDYTTGYPDKIILE